ncbi:alpha/beta hydrolase [Pseudonocardia sp. ICBG1293]|uniref:alpha/beta hydrolase n=1 Tax=Pseudonocardia sp. ICBG1293 TaxID=2844382 RepID=UPI001CCD1874|nr:alpha/beta hydrolase [Pseudonocardia sp. ICBG1293]
MGADPTRAGVTVAVDPADAGRTAAFYRARPAGRGPADLPELRAARAAMPPPVPASPPAVPVVAEADGHAVPVRVTEPAGPPRGVLLEIHGGGFYLGSAAAGDLRNRALADALGVAVVAVDYRLAPERPWPAAPDDCATAALWLLDRAPGLFGTDRVAFTGASAGATLVATTLLRLRDRGLVGRVAGAELRFGTYDLSATTPAGRRIADEYFLRAYAGHVADRTDPDLSPVFADLTGLPPVLLTVGTDDVLLDDDLAMADRLVAAGVDVDLRLYPGVPHGFTGHDTPVAELARRHAQEWLSGRLAAPPR